MTPKEECEVLMNILLPYAQDLVKKHAEFYPVGATMDNNSDTSLTAVHTGEEYPDPRKLLADMTKVHKAMAEKNEIKACGVVWNAAVTMPDGGKTDAIIVSLEHQSGYSVIVGMPYKIKMFKKISFGEIFAQNGKHDVFG